MPLMATTAEIRAWLRAQGEQVNDRGALPAQLIDRYNDAHGRARLEPLPPPGDSFYDDIGELVPDEPEPQALKPDGTAQPAASALPPPAEDAGPVTPDAPPAHGKRGWNRQPKQPQSRPRLTKVTAGVRTDINAKVSFALQVPGTIWQARDPLCGGTFVEMIPETADALTDIICDSPDLIAFFTGPGGNFMKVLKLGAALMPVVQVVAAHHVYHTIEIGEADAEPQARYAA